MTRTRTRKDDRHTIAFDDALQLQTRTFGDDEQEITSGLEKRRRRRSGNSLSPRVLVCLPPDRPADDVRDVMCFLLLSTPHTCCTKRPQDRRTRSCREQGSERTLTSLDRVPAASIPGSRETERERETSCIPCQSLQLLSSRERVTDCANRDTRCFPLPLSE